jgi:hypothetical protein
MQKKAQQRLGEVRKDSSGNRYRECMDSNGCFTKKYYSVHNLPDRLEARNKNLAARLAKSGWLAFLDFVLSYSMDVERRFTSGYYINTQNHLINTGGKQQKTANRLNNEQRVCGRLARKEAPTGTNLVSLFSFHSELQY